MTDHDDFDRSLADRLRAAEGRLRVGATPDLETLDAGAQNRRLMLAAGGAAAVALVLAVTVGPRLVTDPSTGASVSPEPSAAPSITASPTPTRAPEPTAEPTPEPTPVGPITRWAPTATFTSEGMATETRDVAYAAGNFVAVGYAEPADTRGEVGPPNNEPRVWTSPDGRSWAEVDPAPFANAHLNSVVTLPDGDALIYGWVDRGDLNGTSDPAAWRSSDGQTWTRAELTLPPLESVSWRVAAGAKGYLTMATTSRTVDGESQAIWYSADGLTWESVHAITFERGAFRQYFDDWGAGPEGFVVTGAHYPGDSGEEGATAFVLASSDGRAWLEADAATTPTPYRLSVAPLGPDWIIVASDLEPTVTAWFSANGLAWEQRGRLDLPVPSHEWEPLSSWFGDLVSTGERVLGSAVAIYCCHGPWWATGVWWTASGSGWDKLGFPPGTAIRGAAVHGDTIVLAGFDRARPEDDFAARAVFWIGERD